MPLCGLTFAPFHSVIFSAPDGAYGGICTLSCITPATMPGASPAYVGRTGSTPIPTVIGSAGAGVTCGGGKVTVVILPVTPCG